MKKVILNQKSNLLYDEVVSFKKAFDKLKAKNYEFILFPSVEYLSMFKDSKYLVGTQNFFSYTRGSFTGEINLEALKDMGINYTMVGHFERRKIIGESVEMSKEKLFKSLSSKCNTILCVGEDSKLKRRFSTIKKEITYYLKSIDSSSFKYLSIAYIPNYAISVADKSIESISKTLEKLRKFMKNKYGLEVEIYYGGYIENSNIKEIFDMFDGIVLDNQSSDIGLIKELLKEL